MIETSAVPALQLSGLVKRFEDKLAVAGIDLVVPPTSFYGLVGPNGAGKTTTLSMATGLLRPDAGTAWVHGVDVWADPVAAKAMIGNLADGVRLFDRLTGEQLITYTAMMFSVPREQIAPRVADLLDLMDLREAAGVIVADYSAGMTKKVALACALVHAPRLLVLDEPFNGRSRLGRQHRGRPALVHRHRRHRHRLEPFDGPRAAHVRPCRGDRRGPGARGGHRRRGAR